MICVAVLGHQDRKVRWDAVDAGDQSDWTCRGRDESVIVLRPGPKHHNEPSVLDASPTGSEQA